MAASAAFERLQPWSAHGLALWVRIDSASRLLLLRGPVLQPRESVALAPRELLAHLVLAHWLRRCAPVTHQDQGSARLAVRGPWLHWQPQKTLCSPPCPMLAASQAGRTGLWLRASAIQPLVAHGAGATNSSAWAGSAPACNQVSWFFQRSHDTAGAVPLIVFAPMRFSRRSWPRRMECRP
jgi:hypothetical protein